MFTRFITFLHESKTELKKVAWPTRAETIRSTIAVIGISGALAAVLGGLDFGLQYVLNNFIL